MAKPRTLAEFDEAVAAKRQKLGELFKPYPDVPEDSVKEIQTLNAELTDLMKEREPLAEMQRIKDENDRELKFYTEPTGKRLPPGAPKPDNDEREAQNQKGIGQIIAESEQYKRRDQKGRFAPVRMPRKALFSSTSTALADVRLPRVQESAQRMDHVADLMPEGEASGPTLTYLEETTFTNGADTVAEGAAKPEGEIGLVERTINIRKIAVLLPVTDEILADATALRSYLESRMRLMVQLKEDQQLVSGTGTAPQIRGLLNFAGIQTQAKGADPTPDAVYKAMTKIMVNAFLNPDAAIFHPNDWQDIRLLRTTDGIYIWGSPADPGPERIWGLTVTKTTAMTENTALVGAFQAVTQVWRIGDIEVDATDSHGEFFAQNKVMLRAEERLGLAVYRPAGLCTVTGI
jgi:HK97 family phage major capsid protein